MRPADGPRPRHRPPAAAVLSRAGPAATAPARWRTGTGSARWRLLDGLGLALYAALAGVALVGLVLPTLVVVVGSFDSRTFLAFPPQGFSLRWYQALLENRNLLNGVSVSLRVAGATILLDILLGVPAALALVRGRFPGREAVTAFVLSPLMLPGIVLGIAILLFSSLLGLQPSGPLLVASHVVFSLPFLVRIVMARLAGLDPALEDAALNLGASPRQAFWYVTLPRLWPGILTGALFAFIESFDNVPVSLFTAPVRERTLPVELYYLLATDVSPVVAAVSTVEIVLVVAALVLVARVADLTSLTRQR